MDRVNFFSVADSGHLRAVEVEGKAWVEWRHLKQCLDWNSWLLTSSMICTVEGTGEGKEKGEWGRKVRRCGWKRKGEGREGGKRGRDGVVGDFFFLSKSLFCIKSLQLLINYLFEKKIDTLSSVLCLWNIMKCLCVYVCVCMYVRLNNIWYIREKMMKDKTAIELKKNNNNNKSKFSCTIKHKT